MTMVEESEPPASKQDPTNTEETAKSEETANPEEPTSAEAEEKKEETKPNETAEETSVKADDNAMDTSEPEKLVNPEDIAKDPELLKEAVDTLATLDVLVCGQCHTAYHFVEEFQEHKNGTNCTGKSPVRDSNEAKTQVWSFLLWKCSSAREAASAGDKTWDLYQQWCTMPLQQRNAWIAAGSYVQTLSKYAHAKVEEKEEPKQVIDNKKKGRPQKRSIKDDSETQQSAEEYEAKPKPKIQKVQVQQKTPLQKAKELIEKESVRNAQERVPPEQRIARRTEEGGDPADVGEFVVEKILAKRFNPRRKQYEYLLKWEGYPHENNTWEPLENMETCRNLLDAFEKQLARQKELKALKAQQQQAQAAKVKQATTPTPPKKVEKTPELPTYTPAGRLQRHSKARALDQVKAWCGLGAADVKQEEDSDDEFSDSLFKVAEKKPKLNGESPIKTEITEKPKAMPNIKGVIKVDPKHMPNLSTGVYIMSKSAGIMKIDSPGKIGPNLNIDQDIIRKQIIAAKQKKLEEAKKLTAAKSPVAQKRPLSQQVVEKTIITPSGQKIIQRTIHRTPNLTDGRSPVNILNKKLAQGDSLLKRGSGGSTTPRGRGRVISSTPGGNIVRITEKTIAADFDNWEQSSDSSDGIEDPFPTSLGPLPSPSPERELTLDPETGKRLARAEGEPTPPPTPPPRTPTPTPPPTPTLCMKVEMSPGGTTGMLVHSDGSQPAASLPVLTDDDATEKMETNSMEQLLDGDGVSLLQSGQPIMIRGEDGVLYQVAGENEAGQTLLVAAEGVEGADGDTEGVMYVTREDGQEVLAIEPSQLAQLMPGSGIGAAAAAAAGGAAAALGAAGLAAAAESAGVTLGGGGAALQQVAVQVEGDGDETTQVIAQLVQADLPSPGGTRRVVLLLPDGSFTMTELDKDQYEAIIEGTQEE